jgi:hypothetical protein
MVEAGPVTDRIIADDPVERVVNPSRVEQLSRAAPAVLRSSTRGRILILAILFERPHLMLAAGCCPLALRLNRGVDHCETPANHRLPDARDEPKTDRQFPQDAYDHEGEAFCLHGVSR